MPHLNKLEYDITKNRNAERGYFQRVLEESTI